MSRSVCQTHRGTAHTPTQKVNPSGRRSYADSQQTRVGRTSGIDGRPLGAVHRQWVVHLGTDAELLGSIICRVRLDSSDTKLRSEPTCVWIQRFST
jgi:hypothetical protein